VADYAADDVGIADDDAEFEVDRERLISEIGAAEQRDAFIGGNQLGVQAAREAPTTGRRFSGQAQNVTSCRIASKAADAPTGPCSVPPWSAVLSRMRSIRTPRRTARSSSRTTSVTPNAAKLTISNDCRESWISSLITELVSLTAVESLAGH